MKQHIPAAAMQDKLSAPFRLIRRFCLLGMRAGLHPVRYGKACYGLLRLTTLIYRRKAQHFLTIVRLVGPAQMIWAKLTKRVVVVKVSYPACRFPFVMRYPASDAKVFAQIFIDRDYEFAVMTEPAVIVDAGANIGLSAIYFANRYPRAKVIALEPEGRNFALLKQNVAPYANIVPLQTALWHRNAEVPILDAGRGEWGFITWQAEAVPPTASPQAALPAATVAACTVDQLMANLALDRIHLLKIDIEGAEVEVFRETAAWIDKVDTLIIELHDYLRPGCQATFERGAQGFDAEWTQGENIIRTKGNRLTKGK